ncbi:MAG: HAD family phosphatase [Bacteroidales bacterium]|nr:HAD family phosphatase [Bacteroidales bacterium]
MIKNIIFDMGGVVFDLSTEEPIRRFEALGVADARTWLDPFHQNGLFGQLEGGLISCEEFRAGLSKAIGKELTHAQCEYAWKGFIQRLPQKNLDKLAELRRRGYRLFLLSNTNPYITAWAHSPEFSNGHPMDDWFDHLYFSCDMVLMKPAPEIFQRVLDEQHLAPAETLFVDDSPANTAAAAALGLHTMCPQGNSDWTIPIDNLL